MNVRNNSTITMNDINKYVISKLYSYNMTQHLQPFKLYFVLNASISILIMCSICTRKSESPSSKFKPECPLKLDF